MFDKLTDIFEYVAEVTAEYENQDLNYGVWDYTNAEIDYGTPIKNFMEWIMSKCKMIHDGEATKLKPTEESYEMYDYDDRHQHKCRYRYANIIIVWIGQNFHQYPFSKYSSILSIYELSLTGLHI